MTPFRDTVRLINGIERYLYLTQESNVILLGKRLWSKIEKFCASVQHILSYLRNSGLVERRV